MVYIDGLASGLDTTSIIEQLLDIERRPVNALQTRIADVKKQQTALMTVSAQLLSLRMRASSLALPATFNTADLTSSNPDVLTASGQVTAEGSYTFEVSRLAQSGQAMSRGFADEDDTPVGAGSLKLELGNIRLDRATSLDVLNGMGGVRRGRIKITDRSGGSAVIDLSDAVTMQDVINRINESDDINVTARVNFHNSDGRGIEIIDETGQVLNNLSVEEVSGGATAADLGILKSVAGDTLTGDAIIYLADEMPLSILNDGNGVHSATGDDFRISLRDGVTTFDVDISDAHTLGDVVEAINTADGNPGTLVASISEMGLKLVDTSTSEPGTLSVTALGASMAAADLGIAKSETGGGASYTMTGDAIMAGLNTVLLKSVNGGNGVGRASGVDDFHVVFSNGIACDVNIDTAQTIHDVFRLINEAGIGAGASPTGEFKINEYGNGLLLIDGQGGAGDITITALNDSAAAADLGIEGVGEGDTIVGRDIDLKYIGENTLLADLNGGRGVLAGKIRITDSSGASSVVDLAQETTIGDVLRDINGAAVNVTATINSTGDGILITDNAGGSGLLRIEEVDGGTTASDLNILGTAAGAASNYIDGSFEFTVEIGEEDTLEDLINKINALNSGIQASVINVGGPLPYRMSVVGQYTGLANSLNIDDRDSVLDLTATSRAQDAVLLFGSGGGAASPAIITSATNQVDNVVPGMTLSLNSVSSSPVVITAGISPDAAADAVQGFVDSYNEIMASIEELTDFNTETFEKGVLFGNSTINSIKQQLSGMIMTPVEGVEGSLTMLAQVGIRLSGNGRLQFDRTEFESKFDDNREGLVELFTATRAATETTLLEDLNDGLGVETVAGDDFRINLRDGSTITVNVSGALTLGDVLRLINDDSENDGRLVAAISEDGRSLKLVDSGPGTGEISVDGINGSRAHAGLGLNFALSNSGGKFIGSPLNPEGAPGIAHRLEDLLDFLTDPSDGSIASATDGLDQKIEGYEKSIEKMEERLEKKEKRLRDQFTQLELAMSESQSTLARLQQQMASLQGMS